MSNARWPDELRARLLVLRAQGLSFAQCAKVLGVTRMAAGNEWRRHRLGRAAYPVRVLKGPQRRNPRLKYDATALAGRWDETNLTQRWADRKRA